MLHLPYPLERFESLRTAEVRGVDTWASDDGTDQRPPRLRAGLDRAKQVTDVVTGDETLLKIPYAVHYTVADAYRHRFGVADSVDLVVALSATALQRAAVAADDERDPGRRASGLWSSTSSACWRTS